MDIVCLVERELILCLESILILSLIEKNIANYYKYTMCRLKKNLKYLIFFYILFFTHFHILKILYNFFIVNTIKFLKRLSDKININLFSLFTFYIHLKKKYFMEIKLFFLWGQR